MVSATGFHYLKNFHIKKYRWCRNLGGRKWGEIEAILRPVSLFSAFLTTKNNRAPLCAPLPDLGINNIGFHKRLTPPNLPLGALIETSGFGLLIRPPLDLEGSLNKLSDDGWTLEDGGVDLQCLKHMCFVLRTNYRTCDFSDLDAGTVGWTMMGWSFLAGLDAFCGGVLAGRGLISTIMKTQSYSIILTKHFLLAY